LRTTRIVSLAAAILLFQGNAFAGRVVRGTATTSVNRSVSVNPSIAAERHVNRNVNVRGGYYGGGYGGYRGGYYGGYGCCYHPVATAAAAAAAVVTAAVVGSIVYSVRLPARRSSSTASRTSSAAHLVPAAIRGHNHNLCRRTRPEADDNKVVGVLMRTLALLFLTRPHLPTDRRPLPRRRPPPPPHAPSADRTAIVTGTCTLTAYLEASPRDRAVDATRAAAKTKLSAADFVKVAAAVPNMDGLLKAAPKASSSDLLAGKATAALGGVGTAAAAAGTLSKLGLKPEAIVKLTPALVKIVQSKGGAEVGALLAGALK
jgi:hypothetical protein